MAVSLGIWYDSDSPQVCDVECYTLIRGAEFREVSLVYHPGFPIATIEAVEVAIRTRAKKIINEARFDHYANNVNSHIEIGGGQSMWFNTSGTATVDITASTSTETRTYQLQPTMSLPKTTGEIKIPNNPEIKKPEDTMKDKEKADEELKKKLRKKTTLTNLQEVVKVDNSHPKGQLHNLE